MKKISLMILAASMFFNLSAKKQKFALATETDSVSYSLGVVYASGIKTNLTQLPGGGNLDLNTCLEGIRQVFSSEATIVDETEANSLLTRYFAKAEEAKMKETKAKSENFLAENAKREGVKVLPSGLQYEVLTQGNGEIPTIADRVKVHYRGTLIDGREFDSSYSRNQPATFGVTQVIRGWTEALQLMPVGSKWRLFIPAELAYGDQKIPGSIIEPFSTLIFDVELLEIVKY